MNSAGIARMPRKNVFHAVLSRCGRDLEVDGVGARSGERRVGIGEQEQVGVDVRRVPHPRRDEVVQAVGDAAGEEGDDPGDDDRDLRGDRPQDEDDEVRDHEQAPEEHGQPVASEVVSDDDLDRMWHVAQTTLRGRTDRLLSCRIASAMTSA